MDPRPGSLIRYAAVAAAPWRNGGGRTRELRAGGGWRLSVATIAAAGEFSAFAGRDRTLVVGRGRLLLAVGDHGTRRLAVGDQIRFPGEAPVVAEPVGGPVVAVNVMTDRARCTASVRTIRLDGAAPPAAALVLLAGDATVDGEELEQFDALLDAEARALCGAGALVARVSIEEGQS